MSVVLRRPGMTRDEFFAWAEADGGRWEFDGFEPVAMTGGNLSHSQIGVNLITAFVPASKARPVAPSARTPAWLLSATPSATRMRW